MVVPVENPTGTVDIVSIATRSRKGTIHYRKGGLGVCRGTREGQLGGGEQELDQARV